MPDTSVVREATAQDAQSIAEIYSESILARDSTMDTEPASAHSIAALLDSLTDREIVCVVEYLGQVKGWGIVKKYSDRPGYAVACETSVYLYRDQVRRGLGKQVQMHLHNYARSVGYHHIVTKIWADNGSSIAFHEACGFTTVGIQKEIGRVDGIWRDVAIMQCILD